MEDAVSPALIREDPKTGDLQESHFLTHPPPLSGLLPILGLRHFSAGTRIAGEKLV